MSSLPSHSTGGFASRRAIITSSIIAFACLAVLGLPLWFLVAVESYGLSPSGSPGAVSMRTLLTGVLMLTLLIPVVLLSGIAGLFFRHVRIQAMFAIAVGLVALLSAMEAREARWAMRRGVFAALGERSMPLVDAIKRYETDRGLAPQNLHQLVPDYLPAIPSTGIGMHPEYSYQRGSADDDFPWLLYVKTPSGGINWDKFIYLPSEQYPERGWGGRLERVGRWAYVHE